jgi:hypothetical protein
MYCAKLRKKNSFIVRESYICLPAMVGVCIGLRSDNYRIRSSSVSGLGPAARLKRNDGAGRQQIRAAAKSVCKRSKSSRTKDRAIKYTPWFILFLFLVVLDFVDYQK